VPEPERGQPFNYWTQGAAVAEVEIDCLTGDFEIRRADVLVDLGCSVNPALDVGQIEGAFVQGAGWLTTEELVFAETGSAEAKHAWFKAPAGSLLTAGPGNYKLPAFNDVPRDLRVELLDRADNQFAVHSSKAVGEPPFFLGASVLFALQSAVAARRADFGLDDYLELRAPATPERIRMFVSVWNHLALDARRGHVVERALTGTAATLFRTPPSRRSAWTRPPGRPTARTESIKNKNNEESHAPRGAPA